MKRVLLLMASLASLTFGAQAFSQTTLFRDIVYGAPASSFSAAQNYYDCSADAGSAALCLDDTTFLDEPFGLVLKLTDNEVTSVIAVADYSEAVYGKLFGALSENFTFIGMENKQEFFDLIERARAATNEQAFTDQISLFESSALSDGQLSYYFIEQSQAQIEPMRSATEVIRTVGPDVRLARLIVTEDQDGAFAMAEFSLPGKDSERLQSNMEKAKKEKF